MIKLAQRLGASRFEADEHYLRALAAFRRNDLERALNHVEGAIERQPRHAEYHATAGWFHHKGGDTLKARDAYDKALAINPYEMLANYGLGMLAYKDKDWEAASDYFLNAVAAKPDRPETLYFLALVQHRQGNNERALRWMAKAKQAFVALDDKRKNQCDAWIREFEQLAN